ncbi:MAG TPA: cyclase family protein [Bryobacteraceae bacterium]|nr:cyclase family protein [Bryobacteraceae bacterium]
MTFEPIDISRTIDEGVPVYPGDPPVRMERIQEIAGGAPFNLLRLDWTTHFLTHVDVPLHFSDTGAGVTEIPPGRFIGDAMVVEVEGDAVLPEHVPEQAAGLNLLFKTRNSGRWDPVVYDTSHVYIAPEAAEAIAAAGANLVGIDSLDVDRHGDEDYPAHRILLGGDVLILEGIDLSGVEPGPYTLIALPLKIAGGDGSPVRAVLVPPAP